MRSYLVFLAVAIAPPALACPPGTLCAQTEAPREEVSAAKRTVSLRLERVPDRDAWSFETPPRTADVAMPWIWQVLRQGVYEQLPRYRDDALSFVVAPVVITGSFDTVPGVGVAGNF